MMLFSLSLVLAVVCQDMDGTSSLKVVSTMFYFAIDIFIVVSPNPSYIINLLTSFAYSGTFQALYS